MTSNKIHEAVKNNMNLDRNLGFDVDFMQNLFFYFDQNPVQDLYKNLDPDFYRYLSRNLYLYLKRNRAGYLKRNENVYLNLYRNLDFNRNLYLWPYQDSYCYMDADFYSLVSFKFGDRFDRELTERIRLVEHIEQAKVFKGVDLQRIVRRFKTQQEFIRATREGKAVASLKESIHDTWLSVLQITDEMLTISREELESYGRYLRTAELMVDCKEAAGRVSPEVWNGIEERFLTLDAVEHEA